MRYFLKLLLVSSFTVASLLSSKASLAQLPSFNQVDTLEVKPLRLGKASVLAEIADTGRSRQRGLMYREFMPEHRGMLFVFSSPEPLCFWMRNTLIPLSIAYLDENAKVIDIFDMQPLDESSVCSTAPAQFALEVNQGWFERNQVKIGDQLQAGEWQDTEQAEKAQQLTEPQ